MRSASMTLPLGPEKGHPLLELLFDAADGLVEDVLGRGEERPRMDDDPVEDVSRTVPRRGSIEEMRLDPVAVELDPVGEIRVGREDLDDVAPDPEAAPLEVGFLALVLDLDQLAQDLAAGERLAGRDRGSSWRNTSRARRCRRCTRPRRR